MSKKTDEEIKAIVEEQCKDLSEGIYKIQEGKFIVHTNKKGYIEFQTAFAIAANELINKK